ncbi:hypothetical protein A2313_02220 [Candidatus Roizmanbacteria bacterium RIFOXYB2_FULL_41_10]|uniref:Uncharacterized protein n=1 Tax=Candidatus Roizmanbacteria bacterium RIFOXYA1_FULL_41_12 TaxID=1802082 RepID=A0A1F7KAS3_9BACT|nr:MAG: hypothetical protein A2262_04300 [Candidatus Roizmanbacteria bacterium RIFOXYA2_FULL_41_8]OGK64965.1 MAG: hypothetical protein A2209_04720 [Candidatus Roizmanbacteria bacterium RIFOXYA1_FULL_41_12]OGK66771.1 MAG: hypothetical protein A2377_02600 [Candidatus Roizmanbacteria bacterium RIFOXYB1_FULL_41_27]OGK70854.1 MAG: hypothetical protein A2403_02105 [Candidatus Roizmanbacteria bacterium RIFOXYC1_FULL_41_16]OGK71899.1 MAG: hypothetical protein A2313_02220 [Candidatus Roizmanbacteria bac
MVHIWRNPAPKTPVDQVWGQIIENVVSAVLANGNVLTLMVVMMIKITIIPLVVRPIMAGKASVRKIWMKATAPDALTTAKPFAGTRAKNKMTPKMKMGTEMTTLLRYARVLTVKQLTVQNIVPIHQFGFQKALMLKKDHYTLIIMLVQIKKPVKP